MKAAVMVLVAVATLSGCDDASVEAFALRNMLEISMAEVCGEENDACVDAVEAQTGPCMEQADWRQYVANDQDPAELERFTRAFYACVVDSNGEPWFTAEADLSSARTTRDKGAISTADKKQ